MSFLFTNFAPIAVAAVASVLVWLFGGMRGDLLTPVVPWLLFLLLEVLYCFPQRHSYETTYEARERVWRDLKRDPAVWICMVFFILLLIPFANNGLCPVCDVKAIAQGFSMKPPLPILPFCVDRLDHLTVVFWFATAFLCLVVVRHALTQRGKRLVLELIVWNGIAVAVLGFIQSATEAPGPLWSTNGGTVWGVSGFFATFGYPNVAGDYFTSLFCLSMALWRRRLQDVDEQKAAKDVSHLAAEPFVGAFWRRHYFLIPAVVSYYAALNTLSRAAILMATTAAVIFFIHSFLSFMAHRSKASRVRHGSWTLLVLSLIIYLSTVFMPKEIQKELDSLSTHQMLDRVTSKGQYHSRVATAIWKDYPLFGCGGWGYVHFCIPKMTPQEFKSLQTVGGINVHNDYLQMLAEHGAVGVLLLAALVGFMLYPVCVLWRRLAKEARFKKGREAPASPRQIFALPAPAFFVLVALLVPLAHAFADCPLRSAAVLSLFFIELAALPGFLPKKEY